MSDPSPNPAASELLARRERELRAVHRITAALQSRTRPEELVSQTLMAAVAIVGAAAGSILIYEPESDCLVFRHVVGASQEISGQLCGRKMPADKGIAGSVFKTGLGFVTPDVSADSLHYREIDRVTRYSTRNMIAVPLKTVNGQVLGVMEVLNGQQRMFDADDLAVMEILAAQAASRMLTAQLHTEILTAQQERERFCREVVRCVTNDELLLVDASEVPAEGELVAEISLEEQSGYSALRTRIQSLAREIGFSDMQVFDFVLAAGEAATNAIKHASCGLCAIRKTPEGLVLRVTDSGPGINPLLLPNVLFRAGFSTKVSLGMGYTLMLALVDRIWLATGPGGTVVQIEKLVDPERREQETLREAMERF